MGGRSLLVALSRFHGQKKRERVVDARLDFERENAHLQRFQQNIHKYFTFVYDPLAKGRNNRKTAFIPSKNQLKLVPYSNERRNRR